MFYRLARGKSTNLTNQISKSKIVLDRTRPIFIQGFDQIIQESYRVARGNIFIVRLTL